MNINQSEPLILYEGMPLQLNCSATGVPSPNIMWSRYDMNFDLMQRYHQIIGNSLIIDNITQNDTGRYFCSATSIAGMVVTSIDVVVAKETFSTVFTTAGKSQFHLHTLTLHSSHICTSHASLLTYPHLHPSPITPHTLLM